VLSEAKAPPKYIPRLKIAAANVLLFGWNKSAISEYATGPNADSNTARKNLRTTKTGKLSIVPDNSVHVLQIKLAPTKIFFLL